MVVRSSPRSVASLGAVAVTLVAGLTCKDLVGVSPETAIRFVIGTNVSGEVEDAQEPRYYEIAVKADSSYAILVEALEGAVLVRVRNPTAGFIGGVTVSAPSGPIERHSTGIFTPQNDAHWLVVVQPASLGPARFRMRYEPVRRDPESIAAQVAIGDTVEGETLNSVSDIDEFTFTGQAGQVINAFAQALGPPAPESVLLQVFLPGLGGHLTGVADPTGDTVLEQSATGRFVLPVSGTYRVVVGPNDYLGPYRFQLRPIDFAPEHLAAAFALGDTIAGEQIDYIGDVDEFTFTAAAGQRLYVFLQGLSGQSGDRFGASLPGIADGIGISYPVESGGSDSSLLGQSLGITIPSSGTHRLRVATTWDHHFLMRGPYQFHIQPVDPAPEHTPDSMALNDSIIGEGIDYPGDVDTFVVSIPGDTWGNLILFPTSTSPGGGFVGGGLGNFNTGVAYLTVSDTSFGATGTIQIPAGVYTLRIAGSGVRYRAGYVVSLPTFGLRPESLGDTIALGDTIFGEMIEVPGDIDAFFIAGQRGERWNIRIQGMSTAADTGALALGFYVPVGAYYPAGTTTPTTSAALSQHQTGRIDLPVDGWYHLNVSSAGEGHARADVGPYRFVVEPANTTPESTAAAVTPGDTVNEELDFLGDLDEFLVTGAPGQEFAAIFEGAPILEVFDSVLGDTLATVNGLYGERASPRFVLPATGMAVIRVFEPKLYQSYTKTGPYHFIAFPINRGPESVNGSVAPGDTLRGEAIAPAPDVDEFQLLASPGDTLSIPFRLMSEGALVTMDLVDVATGTILGTSSQVSVPPAGVWGGIGPFVMPAGGAFFRVRNGYGDAGTATYEFTLSRP